MQLVMKAEWLRAINKAASALRFSAEYDDALSEQAKKELRKIAETLSEIESNTSALDTSREIE